MRCQSREVRYVPTWEAWKLLDLMAWHFFVCDICRGWSPMIPPGLLHLERWAQRYLPLWSRGENRNDTHIMGFLLTFLIVLVPCTRDYERPIIDSKQRPTLPIHLWWVFHWQNSPQQTMSITLSAVRTLSCFVRDWLLSTMNLSRGSTRKTYE